MRKLSIIIAIIAILSACVKKPRVCDCPLPPDIYYLKAKVINTSELDCHKPVLDFTEDSVRIRQLTGDESLVYVVTGLKFQYNKLDKKLYVQVGKLKPEDAFPCTTMGVPPPALKVYDAANRD